MRSLALGLMLAVASGLQALGQSSGCPDAPPFRPSPPPWQIERAGSESLRTLWDRLGIARADGAEPIDCTEGCKAERMAPTRIGDAEGEDALVRVCTRSEVACRFLLLHEYPSRGWGLVDYIDAPDERYGGAELTVIPAGESRWLRRVGNGGGGTYVGLDIAEWYQLRCGRISSVLRQVFRGWDVNATPARYFETRLVDVGETAGREWMQFAYSVRFEDYGRTRLLWQEERRIVFSRSKGDVKFTFDPVRSDTPAEVIDRLFAYDDFERNDFVEFAYERLLRIARSKSDWRREWLREFLPKAADTPKRRALLAALE